MSGSVFLRAAVSSDAATVARHRYSGETGEHLGVYATWLPEAMSQGLYLGWLAVQDEQVIGGAGLMLLHWGPGRHDSSPLRGRVVNVYVEPEYRRQGVARRLLERVLEAAQERKIQTLSLGSSAEARGLYALLGFQSSQTEMWLRLPYSEV